ncbi:MAG: SHOCT domain-containing protein [Jiangellaceae bacterium]
MSFWDVVWLIVISFAFVAYLMVMFTIVMDLFRDPEPSGIAKALWVVALILLPLLTSIIYLITRGSGMADRSARQAAAMRQRQDEYIRDVASSGPADQIARAKELLDQGAISAQEFETLKAKALT